MKKLFLSLILLFSATLMYAQSPDAFNYQAVARNSAGSALPNQPISVEFTIHDATSGGTVLYQETQSVTTNQFGLFTCQVGMGTVVTGTFGTINWAGSLKYLQVGFDPSGGSSYTNMGTNQLLSVPYAKNANTINMFASGTDNPDKMIIIHSPAYPSYGLQYQDDIDQFNFLGAGNDVLSIGLDSYNVGVRNAAPAYPLDVIGDSIAVNVLTTSGSAIQATSSTVSTGYGAIDAMNTFGPTASIATSNNGIYAVSTASNGAAIFGSNNGSNSVGFAGFFYGQVSVLGNEGVSGNLAVSNSGSGLANASIVTTNADAAGIGINIGTNSTDATAVFTNAAGASSANLAIMAKFFEGGASDLVRIDNDGNGFGAGRVSIFGDNTSTFSGGYLFGTVAYGMDLGDVVAGVYTPMFNAWHPSVSTTAVSPWLNDQTSSGDAVYKWSAVYATNGTIQTSDERLKENVQPLSYGLNALMSLNPVSYQWKNEQARLGNGNNLGFLAQDLEKVLPDVVIHTQISAEEIANAKKYKGVDIANTDTYGVKYSEIIPVLVKAIQEQQAEIQSLKAQVNSQQK